MAVRNKNKRERHFSLVYVPDQDHDPKSVSFSFMEGRLILIFLFILFLHILFGFYGYYRIYQLQNKKSDLEAQNNELILKNRKIEKIAEEFQKIRITDEKIRKAFGGTLGLSENAADALDEIPIETSSHVEQQALAQRVNSIHESSQPTTNTLYRLYQSDGNYFNPEFLPTMLPVEGYLTTHFKKSGWYLGQSHYGIDIAATKGTHIKAAGAGFVLFADWTPDFGNVVIISHGMGIYSYYAHAMRIVVEQGFHVRRGQTVALLGSSGFSSAPHLHFEIWKDGEPLDPEKFIHALHRQSEK